jgi:peptide/nickel transport system substrate-binding protein
VSGISGSDRPTLEADPNIETAIIPGNQKWGPMFNGADSSWSSNRLFRQAVAAAMDHEELGLGIVGDPDLFDVNPGLSFRGTFFYSEAGSEAFNTRDQERARALLAEAGYDGEEIVFISTKARIFEDRMATVMQAQLQDVGINMRIDWYDLATLRQVRTVPEDWDIYPGEPSIWTSGRPSTRSCRTRGGRRTCRRSSSATSRP